MPDFYQSSLEPALRLGDLVTGFPLAVLKWHSPEVEARTDAGAPLASTIELYEKKIFAVITPCCSIETSKLVVSPLIHVRAEWLRNPAFKKDFSLVNRKIDAQTATPPEVWEQFSDDVRIVKERAGPQFTFYESFVFAPTPHLGRYEISYRKEVTEVGHWMIDMRNLVTVCSNAFGRDKSTNQKPAPIGMKLAQLSVDSRQNLRDKLAGYFSRPTAEDLLVS